MRAVALSIAGSDPSGGAGIQADLKTFHQHGVYGCAVPTLLTVQSTVALTRVELTATELVAEQLDRVLEDLRPAAAKTGALGSAATAGMVAERLARAKVPFVADTVRIAKHGAALLADDARSVILERVIPAATLVTANADEAAWLSGLPVVEREHAIAAAERLKAHAGTAILVKGGHLAGEGATDVLLDDEGLLLLPGPRIATRHTHGVGCALSAAICANLALGLPLRAACLRAKRWVTRAIAGAPGLGAGAGPIDHFAPVESEPGAPGSGEER